MEVMKFGDGSHDPLEELGIVLIVLKDVLLVNSSKHDMIDARCTL